MEITQGRRRRKITEVRGEWEKKVMEGSGEQGENNRGGREGKMKDNGGAGNEGKHNNGEEWRM